MFWAIRLIEYMCFSVFWAIRLIEYASFSVFWAIHLIEYGCFSVFWAIRLIEYACFSVFWASAWKPSGATFGLGLEFVIFEARSRNAFYHYKNAFSQLAIGQI